MTTRIHQGELNHLPNHGRAPHDLFEEGCRCTRAVVVLREHAGCVEDERYRVQICALVASTKCVAEGRTRVTQEEGKGQRILHYSVVANLDVLGSHARSTVPRFQIRCTLMDLSLFNFEVYTPQASRRRVLPRRGVLAFCPFWRRHWANLRRGTQLQYRNR